MIRSPKARFQDNASAVSEHAELMVKPSFLHAADMALCEFVFEQSSAKDPSAAIAKAYQVEGAHEFLRVLKGLADKSESSVRKPIGNLDGNVRQR